MLRFEDTAGSGCPGGLGGGGYGVCLWPGPGCDVYFAEAVLRLQEQGADLSLEAWVPCPEQPGRWPEADQVRYRALLTRCSRVHVVEPAYTPGCMLRRNQAMLRAAHRLISVYDGTGGGTGAAVAYAKGLGLPVDAIWL